ncbi:MAG TPA: alpha/beta hydrolase, partial [Planctomycetaceae bacterium]
PVKLRLALHLDGQPTLDVLDQDAFELPLRNVVRNGRSVRFEAPIPGGRFVGEFSADGKLLEGWWTQRNGELPIRFVPGNLRPQERRPPFPYAAKLVVVRGGPVRLAGTLTLPRTPGPHAAVVLVSGSGPQDRNGTVSGHRPSLVWADFLTRRGFAVLRCDDRGVGGSTGKLLDSTENDFAADLLAQVRYLKRRKEIDPARIGVLGHSEGAAIAALAASTSPELAFAVLLSGPAIPGDQILAAQSERIARAMGIPDPLAARNREIQRRLFALARSGAGKPQIAAALERETAGLPAEEAAVVKGQLAGQLDVAASRWFRSVLDFDPRPVLALVRCPVLALYGSLDLQAPADLNAPAMRSALPAARVEVLPGLNHMLQRAETGSPVEYTRIDETVAPEVLEMVGDWLRARYLTAPSRSRL